MKDSPSVQTHRQEDSLARVLLDSPGMELQEHVLVSKLCSCRVSFSVSFIFFFDDDDGLFRCCSHLMDVAVLTS